MSGPHRPSSSGGSAAAASPSASAAAASSSAAAASSSAAAASSSSTKLVPAGPQRYEIRGVSVDFPYPAYECQQVYMEKVLQAVQLGQHALLESPTGTGKTLCLLCAALAWRQSFVAATDLGSCPPSALQRSLTSKLAIAAYGHESQGLAHPTPGASGSVQSAGGKRSMGSMAIPAGSAEASVEGLRGLYGLDSHTISGTDLAGSKGAAGLSGAASAASIAHGQQSNFGSIGTTPSRPKIIYASRTHSQLAKVASELKQSLYRPKLTILGSRQQLCVHPVVSKLEGAGQTHACRALTQDKACQYYEHLPTWSSENAHLVHEVLDIEDLVLIGREQKMCPYFYSRDRMADAELVLLPYNYLIDPTIRSRLGLKYDNSLLIVDEAHNLEGVCGDSASFDLSAADLAAAIQEVQKCIDTIRDPALAAQILDGSSIAGNDIPDLQSLAILKAILLEFEQLLDRQPLPANGEGLTHKGEYIFDLLALCKIQLENKDMLLDLLDKSVTLLFADRGSPDAQRKSCALDKFSQAIKIIFKGGKAEKECREQSEYYRVHIHVKEQQQRPGQQQQQQHRQQKALFATDTSVKKSADVGRILSYWCFNPGVAMQDLTQVGIRCMLLTSGTLSPMESFAHELKLPFPIRLENPHVISANQIWVGVLERGPTSVELNSSFKSRENIEYIHDLGNAVVNFSRIVPDGLLVFFPSYAVLAQCHTAWKQPGAGGKPSIVDRITKNKALIVEPRTSAEFPLAIREFSEKLDAPEYNGAVFFAVCRGKVSEGLDFADRAGRAVIVTGLPYPAFKDPKVRLKRTFLDESPRIPGVQQLKGNEWYGQQAARAVNQAIGRVIRHRGDYGAIILADQRFGQTQVKNQLSKWLRPYVQTYAHFGSVQVSLQKFFKEAKINYPDKQPKPKVDGFEAGVQLGKDGLSTVEKARAYERAGKAWNVSAITGGGGTVGGSAAASTIRTAAQKEGAVVMDWNESYSALTDGLDPIQSDAQDAQQQLQARSSIPTVSVNPTLIKKMPTSILMSLLKPASTTTHTHTSTLTKPPSSAATSGGAAASSTSSGKPAASSSKLLRMSSLASKPSPSLLTAAAPVKIELESDDGDVVMKPAAPAAAAAQAAPQSFVSTLMGGVKSEPNGSGRPAAASSSSTSDPRKPTPPAITQMIARVKRSLTPANFQRFVEALRRLTELRAAQPTAETFFEHVKAIQQACQLTSSLLFGFDGDILAVGSTVPHTPGVSPFDSSLASSFEPHVPETFRGQYAKACKAIGERCPQAKVVVPMETANHTNSAIGAAKVKSESASSQQQLQRASSSSTTAGSSLKRSHPSASQSSSQHDARQSLPPASSQAEFVSQVRSSLSPAAYTQFKSVIISLEAAPGPGESEGAEAALAVLFHRLAQVLQNPSMLKAYATLIPLRLRPAFTAYLQQRAAASAIKWTQAIDLDDDDEAANEEEKQGEATPSKRAKRSGGAPLVPKYAHKQAVQASQQ